MAGLPLYDETVARLLFDPSTTARHYLYGHDAPTLELPLMGRHDDTPEGRADDYVVSAPLDEAHAALASGVLSATDPVDDDWWPGITALGNEPDGRPDRFPDAWGDDGPTERDQAAIDAGNAPEASDEELMG